MSRILALSAIALVSSLLGGLYLVLREAPRAPERGLNSCRSYDFDREKWLAGKKERNDGLTDRQAIARELVRCKKLIGRRSRQIRRLLRPPDGPPEYRTALYFLGLDESPLEEDEYLIVEWDKAGIVRNSEIGG